jgi:hypothetical protein
VREGSFVGDELPLGGALDEEDDEDEDEDEDD